MRQTAFDPYLNRGTVVFHVRFIHQEGRAMRDMQSVYWTFSTDHLRKLRSRKYIRREALRGKVGKSYLDMQEVKTLTYQIDLIDRVIDARNANMRFE